MAFQGDQQDRFDRQAGARQEIIANRAGEIAQTPHLAEEINRQLNDIEEAADLQDHAAPTPDVAADGGLSGLAGIGAHAVGDLSRTWIPAPPPPYDENLRSERIH